MSTLAGSAAEAAELRERLTRTEARLQAVSDALEAVGEVIAEACARGGVPVPAPLQEFLVGWTTPQRPWLAARDGERVARTGGAR